MAGVVQQTGEDWRDVELTLSTAQPMLNAAPPDLKMLAVAVMPMAAGQPGPGGLAPMPMPAGRAGLPSAEFPVQPQEARRPAIQPSNSAVATSPARGAGGINVNMDFDKNKEQVNKAFNEIAALEQTWELLAVKAEELKKIAGKRGLQTSNNEGPSVTYHLKTRFSVPSRTEEQ